MSTKAIEALREAACSLLTIAANAGRKKDSEGQENHLQHDDQVRGYARNRANVAFAALAELEAEQAATEAMRRDAGWQPIETAPKDGTGILVNAGGFCYAVEWQEEFGWWSVDDNKLGPFPLRGAGPTHWMPLPAPPAALAAKQESKHG
jgi:hypothetical protein